MLFVSNKLHLSAPPHPDLVYSELKDISSVGSELNPSCNAILLTDLSLVGFEPGNSGCEPEVKTIEMLFTQLARWVDSKSLNKGEVAKLQTTIKLI